MSLPSHFQSEIDALVQDIAKANPKDILQHCANYFNRRLESDRSTHLAGTKSGAVMTDTAGPFGERSPFATRGAANTIAEEDEEHDSFGSPTDATFPKKSGGGGLFNSSTPFGAAAVGGAAGGAAGGSLFGNWGGSGGEDQEAAAKSTPSNYAPGRRTSVSAESMQPDADSGNWKPPKHPKTPEQTQRLKTAVSGNFLFSHLDDDSFSTVLDALVEQKIPAANIKVISQGEEGDYFYVIEQGDFDIYINPSGSLQAGADGMGNKVTTIGPGGSFGELALMYNAPRAATVASSTSGLLWRLDRVTFRRILMDSAFQKRKMYEGFLEEVPLLSSLKPYERAKIADALDTVKFPPGESIIREGEPGDNFYLLEAGEATAYKGSSDNPVKEYSRGDYFGELALLDDKPRAASVVAKTEVKVAKLGRDGFKRLLGPVESIMRREEYDRSEGLDPLTKETTVT